MFTFQLTRLEIENYNQQTEMENTIEMNQHLQVNSAFNKHRRPTTDDRRKASANSLKEVGYYFP